MIDAIDNPFRGLLAELGSIPLARRLGRVVELSRGTVLVSGLSRAATLGDRVLIRSGTGLAGEVVRVARDHATVLPETAAEMQRRGPKATVVTVPEAGHAPALMAPEQIETILAWLDRS